MGEVYSATDTRLDRTVAIKVLPAELASDPERRERFEREAKAIAALNHPHICTLYDVGHEDGTDFLVMEHLEGESLQERLTKGALPLDQALQIAIQIADALDKAHRQGITHRDLKPGNIFLTKAGAKLLDFGLAKLVGTEDVTQTGAVLGTVAYMSPEQARSSKAIASLGAADLQQAGAEPSTATAVSLAGGATRSPGRRRSPLLGGSHGFVLPGPGGCTRGATPGAVIPVRSDLSVSYALLPGPYRRSLARDSSNARCRT